MKKMTVLLLVLLASCSSNPTGRWAQTQETLTGVMETTVLLAEDLSTEQIKTLDRQFRAAQTTLDKAKTYLPDGGPTFDYLMDLTWTYLNTLKELE